jgi:hypothetical protein
MSEAPGSTRYDAIPLSSERQTRFYNDNLRRVFLLIYRIVRNVPDAQDLTQEAFIKALQRQDQLKDLDKARTGCRGSRAIRPSIFCAARGA